MDKTCFNEVKKIVTDMNISNVNVVDVGSMDFNGSCKKIFEACCYTGVDMSVGKNVDIVMPDSKTIPLDSQSVDVVTCLSVLEHCSNPFSLMGEMARILKPSGLIIVCVPQVWGLHNYPHDYWRINPDGMRELFRMSGIDELNIYTKSQITIRHGVYKMTYGIGYKKAKG